MSAPIDREKLLGELGYGHPDARARALEVLYAAGLTNPRKKAVAADKRERIRAALEAALVRRCPRCTERGPADGRLAVPTVDPTDCDSCGGSANRLALIRAAEACRRGSIHRVLVVGGAPSVHAVLRDLWPPGLELRIVPGTDRHTRTDAAANLAWADVVLVWGSTQLDHKVSRLYSRPGERRVVTVPRRGIEALADALAARAAGR